MPTYIPKYAKIKNKYCLCYYGTNQDYLKQLKYVRPIIEKQLPGLEIHLSCRDTFFHIFEGEPNTIKQSKLPDQKREYGNIRELQYDFKKHPVLSLLEESNIQLNDDQRNKIFPIEN